MKKWYYLTALAAAAVATEFAYQRSGPALHAQDNRGPQGREQEVPRALDERGGRGRFGEGGQGGGPGGGGRGGFGGPGPMNGPDLELVAQFDKDKSGWLNQAERQAAREFLKTQPGGGRRGGFGPGRGGMFQPGGFFAPALLTGLDADKDERLSRNEIESGVQSLWQKAVDADRASVTADALGEALNGLIPAPNFGGGPGGPGGGGFGQPPGGPEGRPGNDGPREGGRRRPVEEGANPPRDEEGRPAERGERADNPDRPRNNAGPGGPEGAPPEGGGRRGGGFGGPMGGGPGGGGGMFGGGPGRMIAGAIVQKAGKSVENPITLAELQKVAEQLFDEADKNHDKQLDSPELTDGISALMASAPRGPGRPGGPGGGGPFGRRAAGTPGPKVEPAQVKTYGDEPLYDAGVLRTLFLTFENADWEKELEEFHGTDVEVPATMQVDGKTYKNVGFHFRGMSSYGGVPTGSKRSLNVTMDLADPEQRLLGYKTLNLLNAHEDGSFLSSVLYSHIARKHIPAPKANFVKVVINGESWGVYVNVQQYNKEFLAENFPTSKGARWKVSGSPGGGGGLEYFGENVEDYKRRYEIKTNDNDKSWKAFINLCRVLNETPTEELEAALEPILDIEQTLWFLALDVALINNDGYWVRASDYSIYLDPSGKFHPIPHDMNEAFRPGMMMGMGGPGGGGRGGFGGGGGPEGERRGERGRDGERGRGGPGGGGGGFGGGGFGPPGGGGVGMGPRSGGLELDPLVALDDARKPLRSRLLKVPSLRARYLAKVKVIAEQDLDWKALAPVVAQAKSLIEDEIRADTRKLSTFEEFESAVSTAAASDSAPRSREVSVRTFVEQRRAYLLRNSDVSAAKVSAAK